MILVDYPSSSHRKLNRRTGRLGPITSRSPVQPDVPYVPIYNTSHKMNQRTVGLWFLQSCAYGSQEPKSPLGLRFVTSVALIYT
jgi:hypothetical protein